jgi:hypothetical protein
MGSRSSSYSGGLGIDMLMVKALERSRRYPVSLSQDSLDSRQWPESLDGEDDTYDYTWNAPVQGSIDEHVAEEQVGKHSVSECEYKEPTSSNPLMLPAPLTDQHMILTNDVESSAPSLQPAFEYQHRATPESTERSAFDSDTEDETDEVPTRIGRIRKVLRTSISAPSLRARLSMFNTATAPSPVVEESPESVTSLRARQTTQTPPAKNTYVLKLATDLSHGFAAPVSAGVNGAQDAPQTNVDSCDSPATPATPSSPITRQTKSFLWEVSKAGLLPVGMPPIPPLPERLETGAPPLLPLPPTPQSKSATHLPIVRERSQHERSESFVERWRNQVSERMTVVDPEVCIAQLEQSIVKLEAFAPIASSEPEDPLRLDPRKDEVSKAVVPPVSSGRGSGDARDISQILQTSRPEDSRTSPAARDRGVVVLGVKPSTSNSSPAVLPSVHDVHPAASPLKSTRSRCPPALSANVQMSAQKPSLKLLPTFDFEQPGHKVLDLQGLPIRSTSLQSSDDRVSMHSQSGGSPSCASPPPSASVSGSFRRREKSLPPRPHAPEPMSPTTLGSSGNEAASMSISTWDSVDCSSSRDSPRPRPRGAYHQTPPGRVSTAKEEASMASFMNFTPEQKQRSKVRRFLDRMDKSDIIKGIRESFLA